MNYIIIMPISKTKSQKQYTKIFQKYSLLKCTLLPPSSIETFSHFIDAIINQTLSYNKTLKTTSISEQCFKVQSMIQLIENEYEQVTLNLVVKKLAVIFMIFRRLVLEQMMNQPFSQLLQKVVNKIVKVELPILKNPKHKKATSINKICGYIRELSGSKEKKGKSILQSETNKGALSEIINHTIQPFCIYLLKIMQNKGFYFSILRRGTKQQHSTRWKMINYSNMLGQIIYQLYRLGRYFIKDMMGVFVYMTLLCSKDLAIYYDILIEDIQEEAIKMRKFICQEKKQMQYNINFSATRIVQTERFVELKGFIEQIINIKQKIHYIFGNRNLKDYRFYFGKPIKYNLSEESGIDSFQFILQYNQKEEKNIQKSQRLIKVDKESSSYRMLSESQTVYSEQMCGQLKDTELYITSGDVDLSNDLQYKLADSIKIKRRMNNWLGRPQRKHLIIGAILDKDDQISTRS